jgi:hypothetical protein
MRIHYNNGEKDKIIDNVLSIQVIDGNQPVTVLMANGKELNVSLRNIEMILDETIFEKPKPRTNFDRITESVESLAEVLIRKSTSYGIDFKTEKPIEYNEYRTIDKQSFSTKEKALQHTIEWLQKECENER